MRAKISAFFFLLNTVIIAQTNIVIRGFCKNNSGYKKVFLDNLATKDLLASDSIIENSFILKANIPVENLYKLRFSYEGSGLFLVLKPGDQIKINIDFNDLSNPVIEGSEDSRFLYSTLNGLTEYDRKISSETKRLQEEKKSFLMNSLQKNSGSLAVLLFTDQSTIESNIPLMQQLSNELNKKYNSNPFVKDFSQKVAEASFLSPGTLAPEIELPDTSGKIVKLSSFRGKYVLIDFWASWCGPCRAANPRIVSIYEKYKSRPFEIYAVSLDKNKDSWLKAIETDHMKWIHVSDLKFWESGAAAKYRVTSIPFSILIDPTGNIIAKGLHPDEIEKKLKEIFK